VTLRRGTEEADVRAMVAMQDGVFGNARGDGGLDAPRRQVAPGAGMQRWVAGPGGAVAGAGRIEPVPGPHFAGIWGGAPRPEWRGRGIYRALTAERARSALRLGKRFINSDSTAFL